jgi:hypothetical protein
LTCVNAVMTVSDRSRPPQGFVVALRATIIAPSGSAQQEWLIASRWGDGGSCLSIARTLVPAEPPTVPPPLLVPRRSTLAFLDTVSTQSGSLCFTFTAQPPADLVLAGRFAPSLGSVHVEGDIESMRVRGEVQCLLRCSGQALQFEGERVVWVGEFVDTPS